MFLPRRTNKKWFSVSGAGLTDSHWKSDLLQGQTRPSFIPFLLTRALGISSLNSAHWTLGSRNINPSRSYVSLSRNQLLSFTGTAFHLSPGRCRSIRSLKVTYLPLLTRSDTIYSLLRMEQSVAAIPIRGCHLSL
jgi:hypothetical protein